LLKHLDSANRIYFFRSTHTGDFHVHQYIIHQYKQIKETQMNTQNTNLS